MNNISTFLAGTISGTLGAMGLGGGGVLIIYLTICENLEQTKAQGINLIFFIPMAIIAIFIYSRKKLISWKIVIPASALGIPGAILGAYISSSIDNNILSKIFGFILLVIGISQIFNIRINIKHK